MLPAIENATNFGGNNPDGLLGLVSPQLTINQEATATDAGIHHCFH